MRTSLTPAIAAACLLGISGVAMADSPSASVHDAYITTKVKAELVADPGTKAHHISVTTRDGVVALTGTVGSSEEKQRAEQDARKVKGVADVINKLDVTH